MGFISISLLILGGEEQSDHSLIPNYNEDGVLVNDTPNPYLNNQIFPLIQEQTNSSVGTNNQPNQQVIANQLALISTIHSFRDFGSNTDPDILSKLIWPQPRKSEESPISIVKRKYPEDIDRSLENTLKYILRRQEDPNFTLQTSTMRNKFLFHGLPGTGKTYLAKLIHREFQLPMLHLTGSDFQDKFIGEGSKRIFKIFSYKPSYGTCLLFLDEIDDIGFKRSDSSTSEQMEHRNMIHTLFAQLDKRTGDNSILIIGATNNLEALDPSIKSRFNNNLMEFKPMLDIHREKYIIDLCSNLAIEDHKNVVKIIAQNSKELSRRLIAEAIEEAKFEIDLQPEHKMLNKDIILFFIEKSKKNNAIVIKIPKKELMESRTSYLNIASVLLNFLQIGINRYERYIDSKQQQLIHDKNIEIQQQQLAAQERERRENAQFRELQKEGWPAWCWRISGQTIQIAGTLVSIGVAINNARQGGVPSGSSGSPVKA